MEKLFKSFHYVVGVEFAYKDKREVKAFFIYKDFNPITLSLMLKKVKGKEEAYYIDEAKKIINQKIKDGTLEKHSDKYLKNKKRKKRILCLWVPLASACAIAGISVGTYYALNVKPTPTPDPGPTPDTRRLKPLTFICEEDGADLSLSYSSHASGGATIPPRDIKVFYQIDNGEWKDTGVVQKAGESVNYPIVSNLKKGQEVHIRGDNNHYWSYYHKEGVAPETKSVTETLRFFNNNGKFSVANNIMSLIDDDFVNLDTIPSENCFEQLFGIYGSGEHTDLVNANNLILPATTLESNCYYSMFAGCASLVNAPEELPAATLADACYSYMFWRCGSLSKAPELPATTLADACYSRMFYECKSLTQSPELPATTLANECYALMFYDCDKLINAPELPADTLSDRCYTNMFWSCEALVNAPQLPATTLKEGCYHLMFCYCTSLNVTKNSGAHLIFTCPDTSLATDSVSSMFHYTAGETDDPVTGAKYYYN